MGVIRMKIRNSALSGLYFVLSILFVGCAQDSRFYSNVLRSDVFVQVHDMDKYDFLWVFDNSQSMEDKRNYVKDNMQQFLKTLQSRKAIDFQMAMVTTDFFNEAGALVTGPGGLQVVKSSAGNASSDFGAILGNVSDNPGTSFWEQGLESLYQALINEGDKFIRQSVPLIIIVLTDEDDYSCQSNCFGVEPENNPNYVPFTVSRYIQYIKSLKNSKKVEVSVFPIVGTTESTCIVPSLGARYMSVQQGVGGFGVTGSICLNELPESYENIAKIIADRGTRFNLTNTPDSDTVRVFVDSKEIFWSEDNGFIYDEVANAVVFSGPAIPKNGQVIEVIYSELSND